MRAFHIVHVINSVDPKVGGPATVISRLAAAQAALGHHVTIISSLSDERREAFDRSVAAIPGFDQVEVQLIDRKVTLAGILSPTLRRRLKNAIAAADVVHLHGVWDLVLLAAARIARRENIPYVVRPCGMLDPWCLSQHSLKKKIALGLAYRRMLENAAAIHVLNQAESDLIKPLALSTPCSIIPNGVFMEEIRGSAGNDGQEFLRQFPALAGRRYILFLARLHHKKGLDLLAAAFRKVAAVDPDIHLVVAGGDDGAREGFVADIARAGLGNRVHVVGPLIGAVKYSAYRHATCFCLPSRQEGFSLAVTEALASGLPVAISRETHFSEAASAGAGIEFKLDPNDIAHALLDLLKMAPGAREAMGRAGRDLVKSSFTWPRIAALAVDLYAGIDRRPESEPAVSGRWQRAKKGLIPALRAAGLALTWVLLGKNISS